MKLRGFPQAPMNRLVIAEASAESRPSLALLVLVVLPSCGQMLLETNSSFSNEKFRGVVPNFRMWQAWESLMPPNDWTFNIQVYMLFNRTVNTSPTRGQVRIHLWVCKRK